MRKLGRLMWGAAVIAFVASGMAVLMKFGVWRSLDVAAAALSLTAFILLWDGLKPKPMNWIVGPIVAVITLVALVVVGWPPDVLIFGS